MYVNIKNITYFHFLYWIFQIQEENSTYTKGHYFWWIKLMTQQLHIYTIPTCLDLQKIRLAGLIFRTTRKWFCGCARSPKTFFCPAESQSRLNIGPSALKRGRLCTKTTNLVLYSCMSFSILPLVTDWPWYIPPFKSHSPNLNKLDYVQSKGYARYRFCSSEL